MHIEIIEFIPLSIINMYTLYYSLDRSDPAVDANQSNWFLNPALRHKLWNRNNFSRINNYYTDDFN